MISLFSFSFLKVSYFNILSICEGRILCLLSPPSFPSLHKALHIIGRSADSPEGSSDCIDTEEEEEGDEEEDGEEEDDDEWDVCGDNNTEREGVCEEIDDGSLL
jgi:hypothetical protein